MVESLGDWEERRRRGSVDLQLRELGPTMEKCEEERDIGVQTRFLYACEAGSPVLAHSAPPRPTMERGSSTHCAI